MKKGKTAPRPLKNTHLISLLFLVLSAIILIGLQIKPLGWLILMTGSLITYFLTGKKYQKDILLLYASLGVLGLTPISTSIGMPHALFMGIGLIIALAIPFVFSKYIYKNDTLGYKFNTKNMLNKREAGYMLLLATSVYVLLPIVLFRSGAYHNWTVIPDVHYLINFFVGLNLVGIWDEVFFMSTLFVILRKHFPFLIANIAQTIIFSSFLYELGFTGFAIITIIAFVFSQGFVYKRTNSLVYLICLHLIADFMLYFVLLNLHYPHLFPLFLFK